MADAVQTDLALPDIDWDHYDTGGKMTAPPQAKDAAGQYIQYYVQAPQSFPEESFGNTQQGFLKVKLDTLVFQNNGAGIDGRQIRFQTISAKQYQDRQGKPINASQLGNYLTAAGQKPIANTVEDVKQAVRQTANALVPVTIEWEVYDNQTKQTVKAKYDDFDGPTGEKSPVVKTADNRVLVARAKVKNFVTRRA
jgi:hypothetical protein